MVPFDYAGLLDRLGGRPAAVARLDDFFSELNAGQNHPHAWIGNEPSLSAPWAYDFAGAPEHTEAVVRRIQLELFTDTPGGLPGNDDGGTTSAWYVLSALGLYPAVPGVSGVAVGSPLFADSIVHLGNGQVLHMVANGATDNSPFVQELVLDGTPYASAWIDWSRLSNGATLEFRLGPTPGDWGREF
jgi:putative alpha-1,2-mannosidase